MSFHKLIDYYYSPVHCKYQLLFIKIARALGLKPHEYDLSHYKSGKGFAGEVKFHTARLYVCVPITDSHTDDETRYFMYRRSNGLQDYIGGNWKSMPVKEFHNPQKILTAFKAVMFDEYNRN